MCDNQLRDESDGGCTYFLRCDANSAKKRRLKWLSIINFGRIIFRCVINMYVCSSKQFTTLWCLHCLRLYRCDSDKNSIHLNWVYIVEGENVAFHHRSQESLHNTNTRLVCTCCNLFSDRTKYGNEILNFKKVLKMFENFSLSPST